MPNFIGKHSRISGNIVLKIGSQTFNLTELIGRTLYSTQVISATKKMRWDTKKDEKITLQRGDPIGVFDDYYLSNGKVLLGFYNESYDMSANKTIQWNYYIPYSPGLIELDSLKAQGAKDAKAQQKEAEQKAKDGGIFPNIDLPFDGEGLKQAAKWLGIGIGLYFGIKLLIDSNRNQ